jgi:hypothetical protein
MKNGNTSKNQITRRISLTACATALAMAFTVSLRQPSHAANVTPPPVPFTIQVPEGNTAFLVGHAVGTQNYICLPCPNATTPVAMCPDTSGFAWILFTPQATLFNDNDKQLTTHFFSPNPFVAPSTGCTLSTDIGKRAFVPYEADYVFYKAD